MFFLMSSKSKRQKNTFLEAVFVDPTRKTSKEQAAILVGIAFANALGDIPAPAPTITKKTSGDLAKLRRQLEAGSIKGRCCRSNPRCKKCPTVIHRLQKQNALALDDAALRAALVKSRMW